MPSSQSTKFAAFQFYPRDFLTSDKVARMTLMEVGIYITLLSYAWLGRGIPSDLAQLAKLARMPAPRFRKIWSGVLSECFVQRGNKFVNPRQEQQRRDLQAYVESCQRGGERSAAARRERFGSAQPPKSTSKSPSKPVRSDAEVTPNTSSSSASSTATVHRGGAPLITSHRSHAACGRICVPATLHSELVSRRNTPNADLELRRWYDGINLDWTDGAHKADEPGDPFAFWRARYQERWPASQAAAPKPPRDTGPIYQKVRQPLPATGTEGSR